jgi:hypothetical protein
MGRELASLTFDEWLSWVFDHPVTSPEWYWDLDADLCESDPRAAVRSLTRLFEEPGVLLGRFSLDQIRQGLWFLAYGSFPNTLRVLVEGPVSWPERKRLIESFATLYERLFARICPDFLSHRDRGTGNAPSPVNVICYMWWDLIARGFELEDAPKAVVTEAMLATLRRTLDIPSVACREGALHGLGHWHLYAPKQVETIIDEFLRREPEFDPALRDYALAARAGCVL